MSRSRILSKLIIPMALLTIYSITLIKTATAPVEPNPTEGMLAQTTSSQQSLVEEENNSDIPRPPQAPPADTAASNTPEKFRFVALTDPKMVPAVQVNWLKPDDIVLGIVHDGEAQAYPLRQMAFHPIINAKVAGKSFVITYCILCGGRAASYSSSIEDTRYTFDVFGIHNDELVLIDRQTGSVWQSQDGILLNGSRESHTVSLESQISIQGTWYEWLDLHPHTMVLPQLPEYIDQYSILDITYRDPVSHFLDIMYTDKRLPQTELVLGISSGSLYHAYVLAETGNGLTVLNDSLDGIPVVIFYDENQEIGAAYFANIGDQTLKFSVLNGRIVDNKGSTWDIDGRVIDGPQRGNELSPIASLISQWGIWSAYHPGTGIYGR